MIDDNIEIEVVAMESDRVTLRVKSRSGRVCIIMEYTLTVFCGSAPVKRFVNIAGTRIDICKIKDGAVKIGFVAPKDVKILRAEIYRPIAKRRKRILKQISFD